MLLADGSCIAKEDFEYWFSVVLTIYDEIGRPRRGGEQGPSADDGLLIETAGLEYDPEEDGQDVRETLPPSAVVLELRAAQELLGLHGVPAEDLMELLGELSVRGRLPVDAWLVRVHVPCRVGHPCP